MENIMNVDPGLVIWTLINFLVFLFIITKVGLKPMLKGLSEREDSIKNSIENAEKANSEAQRLLKESTEKLNQAQAEMSEIINKGRAQSEKIIAQAAEEADKIKRDKVEEAKRDIERSKELAIKELRKEVAVLVVQATEKILDETLDKEKHYKLVESYIDKFPTN